MSLAISRVKERLQDFDFQRLFTEELGWSQPLGRQAVPFEANGHRFERKEVAHLAGVAVFEVRDDEGRIPDAKTRAAVHKEVAKHHHENVLIFLDGKRTQSLWYWAKRQDGKTYPRDHLYVQGQPGDLFVSKLGQMVFDLSEFDDEGNVSLVEVARRVRAALDVEKVTKKFFSQFQEQHLALLDLIEGIADEHQRRWYASVLLNRLMFIYFLQKKGFLDRGDLDYLQHKLADSQKKGKNRYFKSFLKLLFFEGFAKPEGQRSAGGEGDPGIDPLPQRRPVPAAQGRAGQPAAGRARPGLRKPVRPLRPLLLEPRRHAGRQGRRDQPGRPRLHLREVHQPEGVRRLLHAPGDHRVSLRANDPPAHPRRREHARCLLAHPPAGLKPRRYENLGDLLMDLDGPLCKRLWLDVLPRLSLLDPACGSGAFLVAAMKVLINVYGAVIGRVKMVGDRDLSGRLAQIESEHPSIAYYIKKRIITDNLFGVDIMEEATEIAKLRLFLALVASAREVGDLEPLPNIDFNIQAGNSLIGLMRVDESSFDKRDNSRTYSARPIARSSRRRTA